MELTIETVTRAFEETQGGVVKAAELLGVSVPKLAKFADSNGIERKRRVRKAKVAA